MEIELLFTASNAIGSRIIRGVTKEPVSHVAIHIIGTGVMHSTLLQGVVMENYDEFVSNKTTVISHPVKITNPFAFTHLIGHWYDLLGLLYLGIRYFIPILPKKNLWQVTGMFMCTEFATKVLLGKENSMITPYQLLLKFQERYPISS